MPHRTVNDGPSRFFWEALAAGQPWNPIEQRMAALDLFEKAIAGWRHQGASLNAGIAASYAHSEGLDGDKANRFLQDAVSELQNAVSSARAGSPEAVVARAELLRVLHGLWAPPTNELLGAIASVRQDLAIRLDVWFAGTPRAATFAIRGMNYVTDMAGAWAEIEPVGETDGGLRSFGGGKYGISVSSSFNLLIAAGDYRSACAIADRHESSLVTPRLRAWHAASRALSVESPSGDLLEAAARAFEQDVQPAAPEEIAALGGSWSGASLLVWGPYFRARAELALALKEPSNARDHIRRAANHLPPGVSGIVVAGVVRFAAFLHSLVRLLDEGPGLAPSEASENLDTIQQVFGREPVDDALSEFLIQAESTLEGFRRDPVSELGASRWQRVLANIDAIVSCGLIGLETGAVAKNALSEQVLRRLIGDHKTWVYEALRAIGDERKLQRVVLALLRARSPVYAQIRHGPLEHGKDIVLVEEEGTRRTLRMLQLKCGDITVPIWRQCKQELEVMYDVPLETVNYREEINIRVGVLLFTGHVKPNADAEVGGWLDAQQRERGRAYELLTIDDLVQMIQRERLYSVLRDALNAEASRSVDD